MKRIYRHDFSSIDQAFMSLIISGALILFFVQCRSKKIYQKEKVTLKIEVQNPLPFRRSHALIKLSKDQLAQFIPDVNLNELVVFDGDTEIASQKIDDGLVFIVQEIGLEATKGLAIAKDNDRKRQPYPKKAQAEMSVKKGGKFENRKYVGGDFENIDCLRVPDEHTDHSFYIRYEGPGWESDLIGYRLYLDWRNAIDIFAKKTPGIVLQQVGLDGFDSYHEMQPWGMDVLKVGSSLGIGSPGTYYKGKALRIEETDSVICRVKDNGAIYSSIQTNYYGWKVGNESLDLESVLSIHEGTRLTHHEIRVSGDPDNLCTGIGKDTNARLFTDQGNNDALGYIATYGVQSLNNDQLGLAVFFSNRHFKGFTEDEYSHIVKLQPADGLLDYYLMGAWEGEEDGIKCEEEFMNFVKQTALELAAPLRVALINQGK